MQRTAILCDLLGTRYPLMQGGMAYISDARLAAAVSNGGGLGIISAASGNPEQIAAQIDEARALTDKPFGVNVMTAPIDGYGFSKATIAVAQEEGVKALAAIGPVDADQVAEWKKMGFKVIYRDMAPTVASAKAAEAAGMLKGDLEAGINTVSSAASLIKSIDSCAEIVDEIGAAYM